MYVCICICLYMSSRIAQSNRKWIKSNPTTIGKHLMTSVAIWISIYHPLTVESLSPTPFSGECLVAAGKLIVGFQWPHCISYCISIYKYICIYINTYIYIYIHIHIHEHVYKYVYIYIYMYTYINMYIYIYVYVYVGVSRSLPWILEKNARNASTVTTESIKRYGGSTAPSMPWPEAAVGLDRWMFAYIHVYIYIYI